MFVAESSVPTVVGFDAAKVAFESVGVRHNVRIVEIVEHVGQGVCDQAACALQITEHITAFGCQFHPPSVLLFPCDHLFDPRVAVCRSADVRDRQEKTPEMLRIGARRPPPTPHKSLALDVHQAPLHDGLGPATSGVRRW